MVEHGRFHILSGDRFGGMTISEEESVLAQTFALSDRAYDGRGVFHTDLNGAIKDEIATPVVLIRGEQRCSFGEALDLAEAGQSVGLFVREILEQMNTWDLEGESRCDGSRFQMATHQGGDRFRWAYQCGLITFEFRRRWEARHANGITTLHV